MLTWGAFNIIGADEAKRFEIENAQREVASAIDAEITHLGIEHDRNGNRAKAYLYCLETRCPQSGWMVPMAPSWVISKTRRVIARLTPDHSKKRYNIDICSGVSVTEMTAAEEGTVQGGRLVHPMNIGQSGVEIKTIRGDYKDATGGVRNRLRVWGKTDVVPEANDIWQERLYCIQWMKKASLGKGRQETFFATVNEEDLVRERKVEAIVRGNIRQWQENGWAPDMAIEPGDETSRLLRERGWTYWHHLFGARQLFTLQAYNKFAKERASLMLNVAEYANFFSRLCGVKAGGAGSRPEEIWLGGVFTNQALNTLFNYGCRSFFARPDKPKRDAKLGRGILRIECESALEVANCSDLYITDPPYADAVNYHEITEFFIAWLRKNPPSPFDQWTWDSRRPLAIKGDGEEFRKSMVITYRAMADHMPDNGLQIVMFTHQDAGVWGDMAQIFWGAGLRVMAAWYIATETTSELKKGGYVQGTVILVLRKRKAGENGYKDEIVQEVKVEVAEQIETMSGLNQSLKGHGRIENLFEDADLQMAGYAAALRVLTKYTSIDGVDMTKEALRPRVKGVRSLVSDIIEFAVQVANEHMVPEGMSAKIWESLTGSERFFFKMMDIETTKARKLDNYQNFAKAFQSREI